ncbi:MAG: hypothetical protein ACR2PR_02740 [Pseudohongiellaceae bacterium]
MSNNISNPPAPNQPILVYLPLFLISLAVLWDWVMQLYAWNQVWDVHHFMYFGQRLVEGELHWTKGFVDKLPVNQFLFWLPAYLGSFRVWLLMSIGACLLGAYAVYVIVADIFSPARGFPERSGHYTALYSSVLVLYLFSSIPSGIDHINPLVVSAVLVALALFRVSYKQPERRLKMALALVASCFCASLAIGLRPYFLLSVSIIPLWTSIVVQLEDSSRKVNYVFAAKCFIYWNLGVLFFLLCVNVLPYVVTGELESFIAGVQFLSEEFAPQSALETLLTQLTSFAELDLFSILLFCLWGVLAFFLIKSLAGFPRPIGNISKPVVIDLLALTILMPLLIQFMIYTKHFWYFYIQFFAVFAGVGAASLVLLVCNGKPEYLNFLSRRKLIVILFALILVGPLSSLDTKPQSRFMESKELEVENLRQLLSEYEISDKDFLAPHNMYVHWVFNQHRHGFPYAAAIDYIVMRGWWQEINIPDKFNIPRNLDEHCQMLNSSGPKLIVFYEEHPLTQCNLVRYDFHDLSSKAPATRWFPDIRYYFVRKDVQAR